MSRRLYLATHCAAALAAALLTLGQPVHAQDVVVHVWHTPEAASPRMEFRAIGKPLAPGLPPTLEVPEGGRICVVIEDANPALYRYGAAARAVTVETNPAVAAMIEQLTPLLKPAVKALGAVGGVLGPFETYGQKVAAAYEQLLAMQTALLDSDGVRDFATAAKAIADLHAKLKSADAEANTAFDALPTDDQDSKMFVRMLRAHQLEVRMLGDALAKRFAAGTNRVDLPCQAVKDQRLRVTLAVIATSDAPAKDKRKRLEGDSLVAFDVEPTSSRAIEVGAGFIAHAFTQDRREFFLDNGLVQGRPDHSALFRPAVLLMARAWGQQWLWATLGVGADKDGVSDIFIGPTGRFGGQIVGTRLSLGVGLSFARVVTGLSSGVEGQPLPSSIDDLSKALDRKLRPGLGVQLSLTGL